MTCKINPNAAFFASHQLALPLKFLHQLSLFFVIHHLYVLYDCEKKRYIIGKLPE